MPILIAVIFLLSGASESAENKTSETPSPTTGNKQGGSADTKNADAQKSPSPSTPHVIVVNNPPPQKEESATKYESAYWPPIWSNWALFFAAIGGGIIGIRTLKAIERQVKANEVSANAASRAAGAAETSNKQSREMAEKELRAYVSVNEAQITGIESGHTPIATLVFKNSGKTPAYDLAGMGGIAMGATFDSLPPPVGSHRMSTSSLPPGAAQKGFHKAPEPFIPERIAALHDGTMTLWVYGEIHYRDVFGINRFTKYRFQIGGAARIQGIHLAVCEEGNEEN